MTINFNFTHPLDSYIGVTVVHGRASGTYLVEAYGSSDVAHTDAKVVLGHAAAQTLAAEMRALIDAARRMAGKPAAFAHF